MRTPDGNLLARSGEALEWTILLPDSVKDKVSQSAPDIWRGTAISLKTDRKEKTPTAVNLKELYAIVPGRDPALSAARLVTDVSLHKMPNVDDGQAFRQMVDLIPAAVKTYPAGPSPKRSAIIFEVKCPAGCGNGRTAPRLCPFPTIACSWPKPRNRRSRMTLHKPACGNRRLPPKRLWIAS